MSHTPGPWQVNGSHIYGPDPERILVCQVLNAGGPEEVPRFLADRQLIAAAPELLEALDTCVRMLECWRRGINSMGHSWREEDVSGLIAGREAIAKAGRA